MAGIGRRDVLKTAGAAVGAGLLPAGLAQAEPTWNGAPEPGASLRVLRWKQFIQPEYEAFMENVRAFSKATGVKVRVDAESWEDIRPKAAVAANVGAGPGHHHRHARRSVQVCRQARGSDRRRGLSRREIRRLVQDRGGLWPQGRRWIALPQGAAGGTVNYRDQPCRSRRASRSSRRTSTGFLKVCQKFKEIGKPPGFALGHATGDANGWTQWCLGHMAGKWSMRTTTSCINSPETRAALEYAKQLYATFIEGVLSWLDPSNNKAFLAEQIGLTLNGISIYTVAKNSPDPTVRAIAADMNTPTCRSGRWGSIPRSSSSSTRTSIHYTKYPKAAKEFLRFMWEKPQVDLGRCGRTAM